MKKFVALFFLELKSLRRSWWTLICIIGIGTLMGLVYNAVISQDVPSIGLWLDGSTYVVLYGMLCFMMMGLHSAKQCNDLINSLSIKNSQYIFGKLLAIYSWVLIALLEPLALIIVHSIIYKTLDISFIVNLIIELFSIWGIAFVCTATIGFSIGYLFKGWISYFAVPVCWLLFSPYNDVFFESKNFLPSITGSLFNLCKYNIHEGYNHFTSFVFNTFYLMDKLFSLTLVFGLIIICLLVDIRNNFKKARLGYLILLSLVICIEFSIIYNVKDTSVQLPTAVNIATKSSESMENLLVTHNSMKIKLSEELRNTCSITVKNMSNTKITSFRFILDSSFNIKSVSIKGKKVRIYRNDSSVTAFYSEGLDSNRSVNIDIDYAGILNYRNQTGYSVFFSNNSSAFLPIELNWYPRFNNNPLKDEKYDINVKAKNKVYTNLDLISESGSLLGYKEYKFSGNCKKLFILSGYIDDTVCLSKQIYGPSELIHNKGINIEQVLKKLGSLEDKTLSNEVNNLKHPIYFVPLLYERKDYIVYENCLFIDQNCLLYLK